MSADSPAAKAGLKRGDIILELNGKQINGSNDLRMSISMMQPDTTVTLKVQREGSQKEMAVKLGYLTPEQFDEWVVPAKMVGKTGN